MSPGPARTGLLVAGVALALVTGVVGGLLRVGVALPGTEGAWLGRAATNHAVLIMGVFFGAVISVERAVAAKRRAGWLAPVSAVLAGVAVLLSGHALAKLLLVLAAAAFVGINVLLWRKQPSNHVAVLVGGACAWLAGNVLHAFGAGGHVVLPWWFAFLILTIAAERLEMTRLMRRRPAAEPAFWLVLALMVAGAALSAWPRVGGALFGAGLVALAGWLLGFDIARRTVRTAGLSRYMAVCLLAGYAWLAAGGVAWAAAAAGWPARDAALHALGLGFVFSMVLGHAPVILPAVARIKLHYGPGFYLPLALLHGSLLLRLGPGFTHFEWRALGAVLNALALLLFAACVVGSALLLQRRQGPRHIKRK